MTDPTRPVAPPPPSGYLPVPTAMVPARAMLGWMIGVFVAGIAGANVGAIAVVALGADLGDPIPFASVFACQVVGSLLVIIAYSRRSSGSLSADTGLILAGKDWWGILAGMGLQIGVAIVTLPLVELLFPDGAPSQGVADIAEDSETTVEIIAIFVSVGVLAPIIEEVLYRGMLLSWLRRFMSKWPAIIVSAAVFSGVHLLDWNARAAVPGLFLIGVVLGWAALRRGDLSLAIPLHAGVNLLAAFLIVWGPEIIEWLEEQVEELETALGVVRAILGM